MVKITLIFIFFQIFIHSTRPTSEAVTDCISEVMNFCRSDTPNVDNCAKAVILYWSLNQPFHESEDVYVGNWLDQYYNNLIYKMHLAEDRFLEPDAFCFQKVNLNENSENYDKCIRELHEFGSEILQIFHHAIYNSRVGMYGGDHFAIQYLDHISEETIVIYGMKVSALLDHFYDYNNLVRDGFSLAIARNNWFHAHTKLEAGEMFKSDEAYEYAMEIVDKGKTTNLIAAIKYYKEYEDSKFSDNLEEHCEKLIQYPREWAFEKNKLICKNLLESHGFEKSVEKNRELVRKHWDKNNDDNTNENWSSPVGVAYASYIHQTENAMNDSDASGFMTFDKWIADFARNLYE